MLNAPPLGADACRPMTVQPSGDSDAAGARSSPAVDRHVGSAVMDAVAAAARPPGPDPPDAAGWSDAIVGALEVQAAAVDARGRITHVTPAWRARMTRLASRPGMGDLRGLEVGDDYLAACPHPAAPAARSQAADGLRTVLDGRADRFALEYAVDELDGPRWLEMVVRPLRPPGTGAVIAHRDVTARKRFESELARRALHDPLTGLPNRELFARRLSEALGRQRRTRHPLAVLLLDLDNFKMVNDVRGHAVGDRVLKAVGRRLGRALREIDTIARFGGDEFTILAEDVAGADEALRLAERLREVVAIPVGGPDDDTVLTASIGIAMAREPGTSAEELVRDADVALYRAKERGRNRSDVFDATMRAHVLERVELVSALRHAIPHQLAVHYQPVVDAGGGVVAVEALARWRHPTQGMIPPARFIPAAEESGQMVALGTWVLRQACRQAREWRNQGRDVTVSVNLSRPELAQRNLVELVGQVLHDTFLPATCLCLEVTETSLVEHGSAIATLGALRRLGVRIALDDFGTGYSSLSRLRTLPVDIVKIDRAFIAGIAEHREDQAVVAAVMGLAEVMGLSVVAEGVETPDQVTELIRLGCRMFQGFHVGRPEPAERVALRVALDRQVPGRGDPLVIREFMRQIGVPARGRR